MELYKHSACIAQRIAQMAVWGVLLLFADSCAPEGADVATPGDIASPTNNYTLNGKVVRAADGQSVIPDILIEVCVEKNNPVADTLYTDAKGLFVWTGAITTFGDNAKLRIAATDAAGKYKKYSMVIEFDTNEISQGNDTWFLGEAEKSFTIKLEEN
ncbi:MAG: radical SAM-associated putative lipoprotein [Tannerellaceae bacterium]|nr:radical SAM-associated putative lipoprotein [Tannerellaceae bacterium]